MDLTPGPREDQERSDKPEIPREVYREAARSGALAGAPSWSSDPAALERLLDLWQADSWLRGVVESAYRAGREDAARDIAAWSRGDYEKWPPPTSLLAVAEHAVEIARGGHPRTPLEDVTP